MSQDVLKFVCQQWAPYVVVKDNRLSGVRGKDEYDLWAAKTDQLNLTYVTPSDENAFGRIAENGSYTGVLGMLHRKEADAHCFASGMLFPPDIVDYIPIAEVKQGKIFQSPSVKVGDLNFLQAINLYSPIVWSLFVLTSLILAFLFTISSRKQTIFLNNFNVIRSYLGQTEIMSTWKPITCIFGLLAVASSFVILTENLIHTDLVSVDYSNVTNDIEDVDRLSQLTPCVMKANSMTEIIRQSDKPIFKRIWKRVEEAGTIFEAGGKMLLNWKPNYVWLSEPGVVNGLSQALCYMNSDLKVWIPENNFAEFLLAYMIQQDLEPRKRSIIETRSRLSCEHGLSFVHNRRAVSRQGTAPVSHVCKREKMDDLFDTQGQGLGLRIKYSTMVIGFAILICLFSFVITVESVVSLTGQPLTNVMRML